MTEYREQKNFHRVTVIPKDKFDPASFRTLPIYEGKGKNKIDTGKRKVIACPVGKWNAKKKRCSVPTKIHAFLYPKENLPEKKNPFGQEPERIPEFFNLKGADGEICLAEVASLESLEVSTAIENKSVSVTIEGDEVEGLMHTKPKIYLSRDTETIVVYPVDLKKIFRINK